MGDQIVKKNFSDINLSDAFFDSLRTDYAGFSAWFARKGRESAYVFEDGGAVHGFLYVKAEPDAIVDVEPPMPPANRLKIGTFKIDAHGTKLGHRFLKKALDHALDQKADQVYLTIFEKHDGLISLLTEFGFERYGTKTTPDGTELVLVKRMGGTTGRLRQDYPFVSARGRAKYLLSIYPEWHTRLFPDSILKNERYDVVQDVAHTNSIEKAYVSWMDLSALRAGDLVVIYRTSDGQGPAHYRSVATSICVVDEVRAKASFENVDSYVTYTEKFSVFDANELRDWWRHSRLYVIKLLYNAALAKRVLRADLIERLGLDGTKRWGFLPLSDDQFRGIVAAGGVDARLVVD